MISRRKQTLPRSAPRVEILNFRTVFLERMEEDDEAKRKAKDRKELADFLAKVDEIGTYVVVWLRERGIPCNAT